MRVGDAFACHVDPTASFVSNNARSTLPLSTEVATEAAFCCFNYFDVYGAVVSLFTHLLLLDSADPALIMLCFA